MQVDVVFENAKVYNIEKFDVAKGQKFMLVSDNEGDLRWFSDNDPALAIEVKGKTASVEATLTGKTTILIMNASLQAEKTLLINVVDAIEEPAETLNATSGDALPK